MIRTYTRISVLTAGVLLLASPVVAQNVQIWHLVNSDAQGGWAYSDDTPGMVAAAYWFTDAQELDPTHHFYGTVIKMKIDCKTTQSSTQGQDWFGKDQGLLGNTSTDGPWQALTPDRASYDVDALIIDKCAGTNLPSIDQVTGNEATLMTWLAAKSASAQ